MATITLRSSTLVPLTHAQVDANFNNLNIAVVAAQATADSALAAGTQYTNLFQTSSRVRVGGADDGVSMFSVNGTFKATGQSSLGGALGAEGLRVNSVASSVNRIQIDGATTGNAPSIRAAGEANSSLSVFSSGTGNLNLLSGGTGAVDIYTNAGTRQSRFSHTASAVNYPQFTGAATAGAPSLVFTGSDANVAGIIGTKGTGGLFFQINGGNQFAISNTASTVNQLNASGAATGTAPVLSAQGSDANIDARVVPKGTGLFRVGAFTANADAPVTGYVLIKTDDGVTRKLAVIA